MNVRDAEIGEADRLAQMWYDGWCDAHHIVHRADGGPTAIGNLLLLCRRHHRMVHAPGGFSLELLDSRPAFKRPDGSLLEDRVPP